MPLVELGETFGILAIGRENLHLPDMAWCIDKQVIRGEIDNRTPGKIRGQLWLTGRDEPIRLELAGNPWRDLAGHLLRFTNPTPKAGPPEALAAEQTGVVGDITASRKVKVPDISMDELMECYRRKEPFPWHWGNSLHLEWFSQRNGRVVIETTDFTLELDGTAAWTMSEEAELEQRRANEAAMTGFMDRMLLAAAGAAEDDDEPRSRITSRLQGGVPLSGKRLRRSSAKWKSSSPKSGKCWWRRSDRRLECRLSRRHGDGWAASCRP
jgi:hypothetical protein